MRVLQILSSTGFHGAEAMAAELSRQLSFLGIEIDVAVLDNAGTGNDEIFNVVGPQASACYRIPCDRQLDPQTLKSLAAKIKERRIDLIHSHCYKTTFYAGLLRPWQGFRLVTTYHNWLTHTRALKAYALIDKHLARLNDFSVGVSTPVVSELAHYVSKNKLGQIDNGIDVQQFCPGTDRIASRHTLGLTGEHPLLGFVGRLSPEKGLQHLLLALKRPTLSSVHLAIVGDGPERSNIQKQITDLELQSRVHLLGYRRDTLNVYHALDGFVLPSTIEAFPMVLLEAMSCGLPVIASNVGEINRIIHTDSVGYLTQPGNSDSLASAIERWLEATPTENYIGRTAREHVITQFSSHTMAHRYAETYQSVLKQ